MNRTTVIGIALIVIIIAALMYFSPNKAVAPEIGTSSPPVASTSLPSTPSVTPAPKGTTKNQPQASNTFKSLFTQAGSHECKYDQVGTTGQKHNVIYIADGKMRGEFRTTGGATSAGDLMVYSGGYLYVWKEGTSKGTKTFITSISQLPYAIPTDLTSGAVIGTNGNNVSWDCHNWIKDASLLAPPSYVTFTAAK